MHKPVLKDAVIEHLVHKADGLYLDATLGGGGHSEAVLESLNDDGALIGLDQDEEAIARCTERLARFGERASLHLSNFRRVREVLDDLGLPGVDGILADLGVSSFQLDEAHRGFSFREELEGPLDMRMDLRRKTSARDLLRGIKQDELEWVLRHYGEERFAKSIARVIKERIQDGGMHTTADLSEAVRAAVPRRAWPKNIRVETRTFQAIRIAVNDELHALEVFLEQALASLNPKGRLAIITFHGLEDRIVARMFKTWASKQQGPSKLPIVGDGRIPDAVLVNRKAIQPTEAEMDENPRARSARLRVVEKVEKP